MKFSSGLPEKGSLLSNTEVVRAYLPNLLARLTGRPPLSMLSRQVWLFDAGCGDWNWMRKVKFGPLVDYIGMDAPENRPAAVEGPTSRVFLPGDFLKDSWPHCDVVLCRHVLQHLDEPQVLTFVKRWRESPAVYLIATRHTEPAEVQSGNFREVDLASSPYLLGPPIEEIADCDAWLSVWSK